MKRRAPDRWILLIVALALLALTWFAYRNVTHNGFVDYDDEDYVTANRHVRQGLSLENVRWAFTTFDASNWHPLTWLSLQTDAQLYGLDPAGYHRTNLLLHLANTLLLFTFLYQLTQTVWRSALVAGLFGVHPLHVESVAWVAERKDVLSDLFFFLTLTAYAAYANRPAFRRYVLVILCFALGLLAKPMLVTVPALLLVLDFWPLQRWGWRTESSALPKASARRLILEKLPLLALSAISCIMTFQAQHAGDAVRSLEQFSWPVRLSNALLAYGEYLWQTICPANLAAFYPHLGEQLVIGEVVGVGVLLLCISGFALWQAHQAPYLLVGWGWYVGMLFPVIGLVQVGLQGHADRYTYLPLIGVFLMVVWSLGDLWERQRWPQWSLLAAGYAVLGVCAWLTSLQVGVWMDSGALWQHAVAAVPNNDVVENNLGHWLGQAAKESRRHGQSADAARLSAEAERHLRAALRINPRLAMAWYNLGNLYADLGHPSEAVAPFQKALELQPRFPQAHNNLGMALAFLNKPQEASAEYRQALAEAPRFALAQFNLGQLLLQQGEVEAASVHLEEATRQNPDFDPAYANLGLAQTLQGRMAEAVESLERAVQRNPNDERSLFYLAHALWHSGRIAEAQSLYRKALARAPSWPMAVNQQAWSLATTAAPRGSLSQLALLLAETVCEATGFQQPAFLDTLAAAQARVGQFEQATQTARKALQLLAGHPEEQRHAIEERLHLYGSRKPYSASAPMNPGGSLGK